MVWNCQNADCSLKKLIYFVIYCNFRHTFVPCWFPRARSSCSWSQPNHQHVAEAVHVTTYARTSGVDRESICSAAAAFRRRPDLRGDLRNGEGAVGAAAAGEVRQDGRAGGGRAVPPRPRTASMEIMNTSRCWRGAHRAAAASWEGKQWGRQPGCPPGVLYSAKPTIVWNSSAADNVRAVPCAFLSVQACSPTRINVESKRRNVVSPKIGNWSPKYTGN